MNYFLYARKSTDVEDKQVRSIDDQLAVLRALAKEQGLTIIAEFVEKQSAKIPGRPIFNDMLARVEKGEAQGIVCWKLDRLARNPVDGGQISWMLQRGIIAHIQTHERSYKPTDNILMMSVEFGMANQYIIDLSANTKRGLHEKARRGEFPSVAPIGYQNNPRTKRIDVDRKKAPIIRAAYELYAENKSRLEDISMFLYERGIRTKKIKRWNSNGNKPIKKDTIKEILTNTFYYGDYQYGGEIYHGIHTPIVSKQLFDRVQEVIKIRGRGQKAIKDPQVLCGLLKCGECGCSITAEAITKQQKNGNIHRYIYYRCTKKKGRCSQPYIREEELSGQLSNLLARFVLPKEYAKAMLLMADKDEKEAQSVAAASVQDLRAKVADIDGGVSRLTDLYIEQDIDRDAYLLRKRALMSDRKTTEEQITRLERNAAGWLQPMREWINDASRLDEIQKTDDLPSKKISLQKIFGSNLTLKSREARGVAQNQWASYAEAHQNFSNSNLVVCVVPGVGIEPTSLTGHDFKSCAYTSSATRANSVDYMGKILKLQAISPSLAQQPLTFSYEYAIL